MYKERRKEARGDLKTLTSLTKDRDNSIYIFGDFDQRYDLQVIII